MDPDVTKLLDDDLLGEIIKLVGDESYRTVAGTSRRFRRIYREVFVTCKTSVEEMVRSVSGAAMFCREASAESRFRVREEDGFSSVYWRVPEEEYSSLNFVRDMAALNGRINVLKWAVAQGSRLDGLYTCALAAFRGHLSMLQWLRKNDCPWNQRTCRFAAMAGRLTVLQWAHANGCPWDGATCAAAAGCGHLDLLQWARSNGCPWTPSTCYLAAQGGHLAVLQWARANGCPWSSLTTSYARLHGHLEVLEWALANGCDDDFFVGVFDDDDES